MDIHDFRQLNPPVPLNLALALADRLAPGEAIVVLTPFSPAPLLEALREHHILRHARILPDGGCEIHLEGVNGPDRP